MGDSAWLELSTRSASGPGDTQAVGALRQPSKRRWGWTGRLPRSQAGRRTVNLEPQGQALGLRHGLLSLKAPDFSPGDGYADTDLIPVCGGSVAVRGAGRSSRLGRSRVAVATRPPPRRARRGLSSTGGCPQAL